MTHAIAAVSLAASADCTRCGAMTPHNVIALCACGERASGMADHTWVISARVGDLVWLTPSFNWLTDPRDPSKGSHLHEFVQGVPISKQSEWPTRAISGGSR